MNQINFYKVFPQFNLPVCKRNLKLEKTRHKQFISNVKPHRGIGTVKYRGLIKRKNDVKRQYITWSKYCFKYPYFSSKTKRNQKGKSQTLQEN